MLGENSYGARGGAIYSAAVCLYVFISLIISLIIQGAGMTGDAASYLGYLCSPIAIAIALALAFKFLKMPVRAAAPLRCSPKYYLISVLAIFGLLFAVSPVNSLFVRLMEFMGYVPAQSTVPSLEGGGMVGAIIVIALLPAVFEELIFRGAVLYNANNGAGTVRTIFLTAFVFALYHGSAEQTIYQFVCGCIFALLALKSGSVLPSMLAHFINNALIILLTGLSLVDAGGYVAMPQWAFILVTVLAALAFIGALVWLILDKKPLVHKKEGEVKNFFLWGAVGIFIMCLVWLLTLLDGLGLMSGI